MKKRLFLSCYIALISIGFASSQPLQTAFWYFGNHAGIQFVNGNPVALSNGQINNVEGCAAMSDPYGNLLFYSDGVTIWDRNHNPMPNGTGLNGNISTTQTLIIPKPGSCTQFYIFCQSGQVNLTAYYSVIDMTLNGGLGDVVVASKNTFLYYPATEKITSVVHQNGTDIWVLFHENNTNKFMAYQVSPAGINMTPVNSFVGPAHQNMIGYMKASHSGTKLAAAVTFLNERAEIYDFDKATGVVSNPVIINPTNWAGAYGLEFSPNDSILYVSSFWFTNYLRQVNLANYSFLVIDSANTGNYNYGALQLAPDGKIYMARNGQNYLDAINNPNIPGPGCNYVVNSFTLAPGTFSASGLPTVHQGFFYYQQGAFNFTQTNCSVYDFTATTPVVYDSLTWNFGDVGSGPNNISHNINVQHQFTAQATFIVTLIIYTPCYNDTIQQQLTVISSIPNFTLGNDTSMCLGNTITFNASPGFNQYIWQDSSTGQSFTANTGGYYSATVTDSNGCMAHDSVLLSIISLLPAPHLGNDTAFCQGGTLVLDAGSGYPNYLWQDSSSNQTYTVVNSGLYFVSVINPCGTLADSINITVNALPTVPYLGNDTSFCQGGTMVLDAGGGYPNYTWQDGSTNQTYTADSSGLYSVSVSNQCGTVSDSINIAVDPPPQISLGNDTVICQGSFLILDPGSGYTTYLWQNGSAQQTYTVNTVGVYSVTVTDNSGCQSSDQINITSQQAPVVNLGPDGDLCQTPNVTLDAGTGNYNYTWQDGSTHQTYPVTSEGIYSVIVSNSCGMATDSVNYKACLQCIIDMPNAFSPNGDGKNDVLYVLGGGFSSMQLIIYNRHGEKVFETNDPSVGWDGYYKGQKQENEVYYYYLRADCTNGRTTQKKGDITLLN